MGQSSNFIKMIKLPTNEIVFDKAPPKYGPSKPHYIMTHEFRGVLPKTQYFQRVVNAGDKIYIMEHAGFKDYPDEKGYLNISI